MRSSVLTRIACPQDKGGSSRSPVVSVDVEAVRAQPSASAAFTLACACSGKEDKEIYLELGMDAGQFSRIKMGQAGFPMDRLSEFCEIVGNSIYPEWIAYQLGCTLVQIESAAERMARKAIERAEKAESENRLLRELVAGRMGEGVTA